MNRRWICSDVWMDILPSFDHAKLGLKMALLSDRFDFLVDKHFDGKTTELTLWREIIICEGIGPESKLSVWIDGGKFVDFPFPDRPLPNKIRFKHLQIFYIDHSVIEFLHANKQIWDRKGTKLGFHVPSYETEDVHPIWDVVLSEIWPIFATSIRHLRFAEGDHLDNLRHGISPTILTDLDQLNSIDSDHLCPDEIADDGQNATAGQALSKWLHTPSKDGQPKRLFFENYDAEGNLDWVNSFKETFLRAITSVSYKIYFKDFLSLIEPFELVNERTNEKLTLMKDENGDGEVISDVLLKRYPIIVGETAAAVQWENDENWDDNLNNVQFNLWSGGINFIGPLSPPPAEEEKKADQSIEMSSDCAEMN